MSVLANVAALLFLAKKQARLERTVKPEVQSLQQNVIMWWLCFFYQCSLPHAVNCSRFCFWHRQSAVFCLRMKWLWNHWMDLCQKFTRKTCLVPCLEQQVKVKWQISRPPGTKKRHFWPFQWPACGLFGKTVSESVTSFLMAHQHIRGYSVP